MQGLPIQGKDTIYDGSGYVYEMRGKLSYIQGNLSLLRQMNWIDRQTRAVFIEFSVYNPNINLVMVSTILVEFISSGSILTQAKFDELNLFNDIGQSTISFSILSKIVFMIFIVYFMICQIKEFLNRDFKEYLSDFWSYIEWSIIVSAWISFSMYLIRLNTAQDVLDFFKNTAGFGYKKLQKVNEYNQTLTFCLGLCTLLGTIKFLKLLRFNKNIAFFGLTFKLCLGELISASFIFFIIWFAIVQLMFLLYGTTIVGYSSLVASMQLAFLVMLGKFDASQFINSNLVLIPLVFVIYNIITLCFLLNIFISIITDAFKKVREKEKENPHRFDIFSHIYNIVKERFSKRTNQQSDYRDHLSILPNRVNRLINYFYRVGLDFLWLFF